LTAIFVLAVTVDCFNSNHIQCAHRKNGFAEVSKNLQLDTDLKIILINYQNNYVGHSNCLLEYENLLQHRLLCLNSLHNYFDGPTSFRSVSN